MVVAFIINFTVTIGVLTLLFATIYKVLPERRLAWRDVCSGAFATAILFTTGKTLIALIPAGAMSLRLRRSEHDYYRAGLAVLLCAYPLGWG